MPDERLELIHKFIPTDRIVPASLRIVDIAGLVKGASQGEGLGNKFLANIKESDAILHVVRCFEGEVIHVHGKVDPQHGFWRDLATMAAQPFDSVNFIQPQRTFADIDPSLFFDEDGHLTEGARSNVFVRLDGRWCTPLREALWAAADNIAQRLTGLQ